MKLLVGQDGQVKLPNRKQQTTEEAYYRLDKPDALCPAGCVRLLWPQKCPCEWPA